MGISEAYFAVWVLLSNCYCPRCRTVSAFENPSGSSKRWKEKTIVERHVEDMVENIKPFDLVLYSRFRHCPQKSILWGRYLIAWGEVSLETLKSVLFDPKEVLIKGLSCKRLRG